MLCSNCGKDIPIMGNVCPWCGVDKSNDRREFVVSLAGAFGGLAVAWYFNAPWQLLIVAFFGCGVGALAIAKRFAK